MILRIAIATLLGAVVLFVWGFLFWSVLPLGAASMEEEPFGGDALAANMTKILPTTGVYFIPFPATEASSEAQRADIQKRHREGPLVRIFYTAGGGALPASPQMLIRGFLHNLGIALLVSLILASAAPALTTYTQRLGVVCLIGGVAASWLGLNEAIWFYHPWKFELYQAAYVLVGGLVMGLVMVGAIETNASAVRLEDTTPIARLTDEPLVVVVPESSKYDTLEDLVEDIVDKGQEVTVTGGSAGGADHILAGLLLEAAGVDGADIPSKLNYTPNSGGGEAVSLLVGDKVAAGISGVGEFLQYIEDGSMRALAVSSEEPVDSLPDVPTITEAGYDVVLTNWRGVVAPGGISDADRAELERIVTEMHDSEAWATELETKGWADAFLTGDDFDAFLEENIADVTGTLKNIGLI